MPDPTPFKPHFNYSGWEAAGPKRPKPGAELDIDFQNIARSIDETIDALKDLRRSDGKLKNGIVDKDALDESSRELWESAETAAENAKGSAQSAAGSAEAAGKSAEAARGYVSDAVSQGNVPIYASAATVEGLNIPPGITAIRTNGYNTPGDGGGALYVRVDNEPSHNSKVQSADGSWWQPAVPFGYVFDSVSDMQASRLVAPGARVRTLGYYSPGDGGGNDYEIVSAGTGTDDGGSFIDLSGSGLQAKGLFDKRVNVKQFGAKADGITDDTQAFQNALSFSRSVYVPTISGDVYCISGLTVENAELDCGCTDYLAKKLDKFPVFVPASASSREMFIVGYGANIKNLAAFNKYQNIGTLSDEFEEWNSNTALFAGYRFHPDTGIWLDGPNGTHIENVRHIGFTRFFVPGTADSKFSGVRVSNTLGYALTEGIVVQESYEVIRLSEVWFNDYREVEVLGIRPWPTAESLEITSRKLGNECGAFRFARVDGVILNNCFAISVNRGIETISESESSIPGPAAAIILNGTGFDNCYTPLYINRYSIIRVSGTSYLHSKYKGTGASMIQRGVIVFGPGGSGHVTLSSTPLVGAGVSSRWGDAEKYSGTVDHHIVFDAASGASSVSMFGGSIDNREVSIASGDDNNHTLEFNGVYDFKVGRLISFKYGGLDVFGNGGEAAIRLLRAERSNGPRLLLQSYNDDYTGVVFKTPAGTVDVYGSESGKLLKIGTSGTSAVLGTTPSTSSEAGEKGFLAADADYLYVHTGLEWKRIPLNSF